MENKYDVAKKYWEFSRWWWIINFLFLIFGVSRPPIISLWGALGLGFNLMCLYFAFDIIRIRRNTQRMIAEIRELLEADS